MADDAPKADYLKLLTAVALAPTVFGAAAGFSSELAGSDDPEYKRDIERARTRYRIESLRNAAAEMRKIRAQGPS